MQASHVLLTGSSDRIMRCTVSSGHRRELIGIKTAEIGGELLCEGRQAHDKQYMSIVMAKGNNEA